MVITIVVAVIAFVAGVCVGASVDMNDKSVNSGNVNVGGVQNIGNGHIKIDHKELSNGTTRD